MFEAYAIGVRIGVVDATGGGILKIARQLATANKEALGLLSSLTKINEQMSKSSEGWANAAAEGFDRAREAADAYVASAKRASAAGRRGNVGGDMVVPSQARQAQLGLLPVPASAGGGSGGGRFFPPSAPTAWPSSSMPAGPAARAGSGFSWGNLGGSGSGGGGGGSGGYGAFGQMFGGAMIEHAGKDMFGMLAGPIDEAARYQQAVMRFKQLGMSDAVNAEAIKFAGSMNIIGTSMTQAMNNMTEAQGVFRESGLSGSAALDGAKLAAPVLSKIAFASSALDEQSQARMHTQSLAMLRFAEMRGGLRDAKTFNDIADQGWKAILSSGGSVNWEQLRQFMARGGVAAQGLNNAALFGKLEPVITELKGSSAGTALMTSYNRLVGGVRIPNQVAHLLADNGIWDASRIQWNSQGGIKQFNGNPLRDMKTLTSDPVAFYENNILPMYTRMGITSQADKAREDTMIFGRTGGAMFSLIDRQLAAIHRSADAQQKANGIDKSVDQTKGTFAGQMLDYHTKVQNLQIQLGTVILPMLIRGLEWLNPRLQAAADWIGAHSTLTKGLVIVFGAVAGLAMVSGSVLAIGGALSMLSGVIGTGGGLGILLRGVASGMGALSGSTVGVGALLRGAAGGMGILTTAAGIFMAGYAGWKAGKYISDKMDGTTLGDKFSHYNTKYLGAALDLFGIKNDYTLAAKYDGYDQKYNGVAPLPGQSGYINQARLINGSPIATGQNKAIQVNTTINLDGKKVGQAVTQHQVNTATAPQTGMSSYDSSQYGMPIGVGGSPF